jgi:hypothetical protein
LLDGADVERSQEFNTLLQALLEADIAFSQGGTKRIMWITNAALDDGANDVAFGERAIKDVVSSCRPSRLSHNGDVVRVAAKCRNVLLNPFDCRELIQHTPVARAVVTSDFLEFSGQLGVRHPAEGACAVVVVDEDDAFVCHTAAIELVNCIVSLLSTDRFEYLDFDRRTNASLAVDSAGYDHITTGSFSDEELAGVQMFRFKQSSLMVYPLSPVVGAGQTGPNSLAYKVEFHFSAG